MVSSKTDFNVVEIGVISSIYNDLLISLLEVIVCDAVYRGATHFFFLNNLAIVNHTLVDIVTSAYSFYYYFIYKVHLFHKTCHIERTSQLKFLQTPDCAVTIFAARYKHVRIIRIYLQAMNFFHVKC